MMEAITIEAAGSTHIGLVRKRNEDAFYVGRHLIAVADGLGGHPAGDIASTTAIEALMPFDRHATTHDLTTVMGQAVSEANDAIRARIEAEPSLAGMGTTLVALLWMGNEAVVANVGDSRVYRLAGRTSDGRHITQVTEDHTYEHLVADADAIPHLGERLIRWLDGRADGRSPDMRTWRLQPGDRFLLCSDGLSSYVSPEVIDAAMTSSHTAQQVADRLVASALEHGGPDNVTVSVVDVRRPNSKHCRICLS